ncbi:succinyl-diaminopimelate desuccinylase [Helicobacter sp. 12S02634-8]|uniref:succinyl-diaminopimelate desuccinylase n=1 Tax=Helicobacter sp. 12S02634-8 TaxID=1476199 RepID=UPI000BA6FF02|nr:succinyl-diaminopimelate desuccinylase [Helicobacter sp. 12S02634-8]PAF48590.1 succinyl-diaminopimelate desuccinylase [Helicobacter sp. 12S02634-8]
MTPLEVLSQLVSYPTITPKECGAYAFVRSLLPDFEVFALECEGVKNLFLFKHFGDRSKKPLHFCFAGHIDVVPPGEGWESSPFVPELREGYLYGRGTQDMKSGVSAFLCALRDFKPTKDQKGHLILSALLTSDEEGPGIGGTQAMLEALSQKGWLPDMAIVAEPTCRESMGDTIKIGRRGSINGLIEIKGIQGHVAYPEKCQNPIELLGERLGKIAGVYLDEGDAVFAPSKLVVTDMRGGLEVVNVTPPNLKLMFNVRHSTQTDLQKVQSYIDGVLKGLRYECKLTQSSLPFLTSKNSALIHLLQKIITEVCTQTPKLDTGGGTSDARHLSAFGVEVVEFGVRNDRIHSVNERVCVADLEFLYKIFLDLLCHLNVQTDTQSDINSRSDDGE